MKIKWLNDEPGLSFSDALATGKPMRRRSWWRGQGRGRWLVLDAEDGWRWLSANREPANGPRRGDMLANDWEVMP